MEDEKILVQCYIKLQGVIRELSEQMWQIAGNNTAKFAEIKPTMKLTGDPHKAEEIEIDAPKPDRFKEEELFRAAEGGDSSLFRALPNDLLARALTLQKDDRSLLHVATSTDRPETVSRLADADQLTSMINIKGEEGWAPIHYASSIGNAQIVEILLNKGDDVNLKNAGGWTALHYAASIGWSNVAEILIAHGAKVNLKDKEGTTALHRAASTGESKLCELDVFVEPKALPPHRNCDHQIPLKQGTIHPSNTFYSSPVVLDWYPPPLQVPYVPGDSILPAVVQRMRNINCMILVLKENLQEAQQRRKVKADKHRSERQLDVGEFYFDIHKRFPDLSLEMSKGVEVPG